MKKDNLSDQYQVNDEIRAKEVRIVGEGFEPRVVSLREALQIADNMELDLVMISPNAVPPVCRIVDFSKFIYQLKKKQKEAKAKQVKIDVKDGILANAGKIPADSAVCVSHGFWCIVNPDVDCAENVGSLMKVFKALNIRVEVRSSVIQSNHATEERFTLFRDLKVQPFSPSFSPLSSRCCQYITFPK